MFKLKDLLDMPNFDKLSDQEINTFVSLIEGHSPVSNGVLNNLIHCSYGQKSYDVVPEGSYLKLFDPLENDALSFQLMVKHKIDISYFGEKVIAMYNIREGEEDDNANKAICLAIIGKYTSKEKAVRQLRKKA